LISSWKSQGLSTLRIVKFHSMSGRCSPWAQVWIKGTVDGYKFRGSLTPMGSGKHVLDFRKEIRDAIGKTHGDTVHIVLDIDTEERIVDIPADLAVAPKVAGLMGTI